MYLQYSRHKFIEISFRFKALRKRLPWEKKIRNKKGKKGKGKSEEKKKEILRSTLDSRRCAKDFREKRRDEMKREKREEKRKRRNAEIGYKFEALRKCTPL